MTRRLLTLALCLVLLALLPSRTAPETQTVTTTSARATTVVDHNRRAEAWLAATERHQTAVFLAAIPPPQREGTQVAQHPQQVRYYEPGSIEALICSVFTEDCDRAVRVARCESNLNPYARNRSGALGLFQLLGHADMFEARGWSEAADWSDPYRNTVVAHDLWSSSGWGPWACRR